MFAIPVFLCLTASVHGGSKQGNQQIACMKTTFDLPDPVMRHAILILALAAFALTTSSANAGFIITGR